MWREFCRELSEFASNARDDEIVEGALETFRALRHWFEEGIQHGDGR